MGRTQRKGLSFLRKFKPSSLEKQDSTETTIPSPVKKALTNRADVNQEDIKQLLKGLSNVDLGSGCPVRPPRRSDRDRSTSSSRSTTPTTRSAKSSVSGDDVFSPGCSTHSPRAKTSDQGQHEIFFSPKRGKASKNSSQFSQSSSIEEAAELAAPSESDSKRETSASKAESSSKAETHEPKLRSYEPKLRSSESKVKHGHGLSKMITKEDKPSDLTETSPGCDDVPPKPSDDRMPKPTMESRERVEIQLKLKPSLPVPPVRKIRIRTCVTNTTAKSSENRKMAAVVPRHDLLQPTAQADQPISEQAGQQSSQPADPVDSMQDKAAVSKVDDEDYEDEGIFSIEDVEVDDLTRTDKAVLLRKKFSQLKVKNNALKMKDVEIRERFAMLQSKRSRISSVTKRSSKTIRSSLIGS